MNILSPLYIVLIGCVTLIYQFLPRAYQLPFIALCGGIFFFYSSPWSLAVLAILITGSYWIGNLQQSSPKLIWGTIGLIAILFFAYKWRLNTLGTKEQSGWLLLGAAFYILRTIHYLIEQFKGSLAPHRFMDYLCYQMYLPVVVIGPIHRFDNYLRESRRRRRDMKYFSKGLERILYGYFMAVVIGGFLIKELLHQYVAAIPLSQPWYRGYMSCLEYGSHLYFTFAGFSSIAVGFSLLLGIRIEENFHYPFLQPNISRFWKSWHITLSKWCRDYIYLPITALAHRSLIGILCSMLILGIWHEWSLRYLLWGLYHGLGIGIWHFYQSIKPEFLLSSKLAASVYQVLSVFLTFNFVVLSFEITRSNDIALTLSKISHYLFHLVMGG